jgi:hypothetical protein
MSSDRQQQQQQQDVSTRRDGDAILQEAAEATAAATAAAAARDRAAISDGRESQRKLESKLAKEGADAARAATPTKPTCVFCGAPGRGRVKDAEGIAPDRWYCSEAHMRMDYDRSARAFIVPDGKRAVAAAAVESLRAVARLSASNPDIAKEIVFAVAKEGVDKFAALGTRALSAAMKAAAIATAYVLDASKMGPAAAVALGKLSRASGTSTTEERGARVAEIMAAASALPFSYQMVGGASTEFDVGVMALVGAGADSESCCSASVSPMVDRQCVGAIEAISKEVPAIVDHDVAAAFEEIVVVGGLFDRAKSLLHRVEAKAVKIAGKARTKEGSDGRRASDASELRHRVDAVRALYDDAVSTGSRLREAFIDASKAISKLSIGANLRAAEFGPPPSRSIDVVASASVRAVAAATEDLDALLAEAAVARKKAKAATDRYSAFYNKVIVASKALEGVPEIAGRKDLAVLTRNAAVADSQYNFGEFLTGIKGTAEVLRSISVGLRDRGEIPPDGSTSDAFTAAAVDVTVAAAADAPIGAPTDVAVVVATAAASAASFVGAADASAEAARCARGLLAPVK